MFLQSDYKRGKAHGHADGQRDMHHRIVSMFTAWATTYPEPNSPVADELWGFVDKLREVKIND